MGFRMRKSINLGGGVRLNLSKKGVGMSVGTKGFRVTSKAGGGIRTTTSIPGTGISYTSGTKKARPAGKSRTIKRAAASAPSKTAPRSSLTAADRANPEKALKKYQDCLRSSPVMIAVFVLACVCFALAGITVGAVICLLLAVLYYAGRGTWQRSVAELQDILDARQGEVDDL